jgi:hypothetical protein
MIIKNLVIIASITLFMICCGNPTSKTSSINKTYSVDTIEKFEPEKYQEEINDSILDSENNIKVTIKKSTRMEKYITKIIKTDSTHVEKLKYRDNKINIKVQIGGIAKFDTTLIKETLTQIGDEDFLKQSIMWNAWINKYNKEKQELSINFSVLVPDTDWSYNFSLSVDKNGKGKIALEEIE